jgi:hypothetical protein
VRNGWLGAGLLLVAAPARAECLGACAKDLEAALLSLVAYVVIGIVLLVMLIRAKWRRAGLWGLALVAVLALGVPMVSQAWVAWKMNSVEGREIVGTPPNLAERVPLLITPDEYCYDSACEAVVRGRGAKGVHVVLASALEGRDLTQPVAIADLPLEVWSQLTVGGEITRRELPAAERKAAAAGIDYLVVTAWPYYPADPGLMEAALQVNPAVQGMGGGEAVRFLMAPLDKGKSEIAVASLQPDLLDLTLVDDALAFPLAPRNTQGADNSAVGMDRAAAAICPAVDPSGNCRSLLER